MVQGSDQGARGGTTGSLGRAGSKLDHAGSCSQGQESKLRSFAAVLGADNASQQTESQRRNKSKWVGFRKELRREHGCFWRGLEPPNPGGRKKRRCQSSLPASLCHCPESQGSTRVGDSGDPALAWEHPQTSTALAGTGIRAHLDSGNSPI